MSLTYSELLAQLAQHIGVDTASLQAQQVLRMGELEIFLQPGGVPQAPDMVLCSVLGRPPVARFAEVLRTLMQANHRWVGTGGGTLGLTPGNAISWCLRLPLRDLDGVTLGGLLAGYAELGQAWMQYLAVPVEAQGAPEHPLPQGMRA